MIMILFAFIVGWISADYYTATGHLDIALGRAAMMLIGIFAVKFMLSYKTRNPLL